MCGGAVAISGRVSRRLPAEENNKAWPETSRGGASLPASRLPPASLPCCCSKMNRVALGSRHCAGPS